MQITANINNAYLNTHIPKYAVLKGFTFFCLSHVLQDIIKPFFISDCELQSVLLVGATESLA